MSPDRLCSAQHTTGCSDRGGSRSSTAASSRERLNQVKRRERAAKPESESRLKSTKRECGGIPRAMCVFPNRFLELNWFTWYGGGGEDGMVLVRESSLRRFLLAVPARGRLIADDTYRSVWRRARCKQNVMCSARWSYWWSRGVQRSAA